MNEYLVLINLYRLILLIYLTIMKQRLDNGSHINYNKHIKLPLKIKIIVRRKTVIYNPYLLTLMILRSEAFILFTISVHLSVRS